jgi:hypothetical protein
MRAAPARISRIHDRVHLQGFPGIGGLKFESGPWCRSEPNRRLAFAQCAKDQKTKLNKHI